MPDTSVNKITCDDCCAWTDNGTTYYKCAVPGHCPALEKDEDKANEIYERLVEENEMKIKNAKRKPLPMPKTHKYIQTSIVDTSADKEY